MSDTPKDLYITTIYKKLGYFATWLPSQTLALGDIGTMEGKTLRYKARLAALNITFEERIDPRPADISHVSDSGVEIKVNAAAEAPAGAPPIQGEIEIGFEKQGGYVFHADQYQGYLIADQIDLEHQLRAAYEEGRWQLEWYVVTEVIKARSATILIANTAGSKVTLSVKGSLEAARANLGSAKAGAEYHSENGDTTRLVAAKGLTPLFRVARLKKRILSDQVAYQAVRSIGPAPDQGALHRREPILRDGGPKTELVFEKVTLDNLEPPGA